MSASKLQNKQEKEETFQSPESLSNNMLPQKRPHSKIAPKVKTRTYESEIEGSNWLEENIINT